MSIDAPLIDTSKAADITVALAGTAPDKKGLLELYTTNYPFHAWQEYDPVTFAPTGRSAALIGVFARLCEIVIERLNQVPQKNFLAFLDLIGAALEPPQPASVPLTFTLSAGSAVDAQVPQGTQVGAPPAPGEKDPVLFETELPLMVTAAQLASLLTIDPTGDTWGDWTGRLASPADFAAFAGDRAMEHVLHVGDALLLGYDHVGDLQLAVTLDPLPAGAEARQVVWERWDGAQWQPLTPVSDATASLTRSGTIDFGAVPAAPETTVDARASRWLRCRLLTPITPSALALSGMVRATVLPNVRRIVITADVKRTPTEGLVPDLGFINAAPLDLSKDFLPFGDKPKLQDTFFLASAEAFSKDLATNAAPASARIALEVALANSHLLGGPASARPSRDLRLVWECATSGGWQKVGSSGAPAWLSLIELDPAPSLATDATGTSALVQGTAQTGVQVTSAVLSRSGPTALQFVAVGGDGRFADKRLLGEGVNVFVFTASDGRNSVTAWAAVVNGDPRNQPVVLDVRVPDQPVAGDRADLTVSVSGTAADQIRTIAIQNGRMDGSTVSGLPGTLTVPLAEGRNPLLVQALDGSGLLRAAATVTIGRQAAAPSAGTDGFSDGTFALTQSGTVTLRLPDAVGKATVNGQENFWLRVRIVGGDYGREAGYALKNPVSPADGFTLVPASFRPPAVTAVRIGYEVTPQRPPEFCVTYNRLAFADRTAAAAGGGDGFAPFVPADAQRPGLYLGFALPPGRLAFPDGSISLYSRAAPLRYGERATPLSPEISLRRGTAGATVTHTFTVTNNSSGAQTFAVALLGYVWPTRCDHVGVTVAAGASADVAVDVDVPGGIEDGGSDRGVLRLAMTGDGDTVHDAVFATTAAVPAVAEPPTVAWQYWNGAQWSKLAVEDGSENFLRSGLITFVAPADLASADLFGRTRYWLRAEWAKGAYAVPPRLGGILLNTTPAVQTATLLDEILGSSTAAAGQTFRTTRNPVLARQQLVVREPEMPGAEDLATIRADEGDDAIRVVPDAAGRPREIWVRWHEVPDFHGSGPRDRHYVIDHLIGQIGFGDGVNGRIPPLGIGNVRLARYQTGGGSRGNCAAGTVTQLKTAVPYIDKVINPEAAAGGTEAETTDALIERMPRTLRHRDRAVTLEDYQDLALRATAEVVRALCVPLRDLSGDPLGEVPLLGAASVVVVPRTSGVKPLPSMDLLSRVKDFLAARAPATAAIAVVGPLYLRVDVRADVALASPQGASAVERAVRDRIAAFLHPLTGGLDGKGWDFGRAPHRSDFFALVETVSGVDHVRYLQITETEDQPGVRRTGRFLVFSGQHQVDLTFDDA
jgi:Baseplate J-like protein